MAITIVLAIVALTITVGAFLCLIGVVANVSHEMPVPPPGHYFRVATRSIFNDAYDKREEVFTLQLCSYEVDKAFDAGNIPLGMSHPTAPLVVCHTLQEEKKVKHALWYMAEKLLRDFDKEQRSRELVDTICGSYPPKRLYP